MSWVGGKAVEMIEYSRHSIWFLISRCSEQVYPTLFDLVFNSVVCREGFSRITCADSIQGEYV